MNRALAKTGIKEGVIRIAQFSERGVHFPLGTRLHFTEIFPADSHSLNLKMPSFLTKRNDW